LLQGTNVTLHNHCYEVEDLEMMMRLSQEFGFKIAAFHHASEAWKLAHKLAGKNITIALFADQWAYKVRLSLALFIFFVANCYLSLVLYTGRSL
jgi:hypothetical protein